MKWTRKVWITVKATFNAYLRDSAQRQAAAIAFYTMFSLAPLLVITIAVVGRIFGHEAVRGEIVQQFGSLIGRGAAQQIEAMIEAAGNPRANLLATIIGSITLLFGATGVFGQLKSSLDAIWGADHSASRRSTLKSFLRRNLLSLAMVMAVSFLLLVSLVFSAGVSGLARWAGSLISYSTVSALRLADIFVSFVITTVLFAMIFDILPEVRISWRDVWIGAAVTSILFNIGKHVIGLYLGRSSMSSVFGAAGSLGILLLWIYYSATIFLLGAEFTEVYSRHWGSRSPEAMARRAENEEERRKRRNTLNE